MFMVTLLQVLLLFLSAHRHFLVVALNRNEDCNAYSIIVRRVNEQIVTNANNNEEKLNQVTNTLAEKSKEFNQINADRLKNMTAFKEQTEKHLNQLVLLLNNSSSDPDQTLIERIIRLEKLHDKIRVDILRILDLQKIISDLENQLMAALNRIKENDAKFREFAYKCAKLDELNDLIDRLEDLEQRIFGSTSGKNPTSSTTTTTTTSPTPSTTKPTVGRPPARPPFRPPGRPPGYPSGPTSIDDLMNIPGVIGFVGSIDNPVPIFDNNHHG